MTVDNSGHGYTHIDDFDPQPVSSLSDKLYLQDKIPFRFRIRYFVIGDCTVISSGSINNDFGILDDVSVRIENLISLKDLVRQTLRNK